VLTQCLREPFVLVPNVSHCFIFCFHIFFYSSDLSGEKPEELKTDADRERAGEWYWMPDAMEGFVPAKLISENAQKRQLETEDGRQHSLLKKEVPQMDRLYWTQLRERVRDLVMLDVSAQINISEDTQRVELEQDG
jgi:hypothetical protein